jgi:serine/threonine-protein kinase ATR
MINNFRPYVEEVSVPLLEETAVSKKRLKSLLSVLNISTKDFFQITRHVVFPHLFINHKVELMEDISSLLQQDLATILIEECGYIFGRLLLDDGIDLNIYFLDFVKLANLDSKKISIGQLFKSCLLILTKSIACGLGSRDDSVVIKAKASLKLVLQHVHGDQMKLSKFLMDQILGILPIVNQTVHNLKYKTFTSDKLTSIRMLTELISLIGPSINSILPQILSILLSAVSIPQLREQVLKCLLILVQTLERSILGPILNPIIAMTCQLDAPESEIETAVTILEYCLVTCINDVENHISSLGHIPRTAPYTKINDFVQKSLNDKSFIDRIASMGVFLEHDNVLILNNTLIGIKSLLEGNEVLLFQKLSAETVEQEFSNLMRKLLVVMRKHVDQIDIKMLANECVGIIGAVDPLKMVLKESRSTGKYNFSVTDTVLDFALNVLVRQLVPEYAAASNIQTQSLLAYTIQELLKFIGFSKYAGQLSVGSELLKDDALKSRWESVPKKYIPILFPLLSSKYSLKEDNKRSNMANVEDFSPLPISSWLKHLYLCIIGKLSERNEFRTLFLLLKELAIDSDINIADHILPCAILNGIIDDSALEELIQKEFTYILKTRTDIGKIRVSLFDA